MLKVFHSDRQGPGGGDDDDDDDVTKLTLTLSVIPNSNYVIMASD
jgi:hypothetical protein